MIPDSKLRLMSAQEVASRLTFHPIGSPAMMLITLFALTGVFYLVLPPILDALSIPSEYRYLSAVIVSFLVTMLAGFMWGRYCSRVWARYEELRDEYWEERWQRFQRKGSFD